MLSRGWGWRAALRRGVVPALVGLVASASVGCKDGSSGDAPPRQPIPSPPASADAAKAPEAGTPGADEARSRLLAWLDPDAVAIGYVAMPSPLNAEAVAVVYGLPPRAEDLLDAIEDVDGALEAVRPVDAPKADTWLGPQALVSAGRMSKRPMVLRPLTVPRAEAIARLEALGLTRQELDAFEVWVPQRVFPYRVVLLSGSEAGDVAGFIPAIEPGTGLPPLIAARDMPPSDVETELQTVLTGPDAPAVALFVAGPMLHLDLAQDVLSARFELRRGRDGSLDGQVALQVEDPTPAVKALAGRTAPEQNDGIQRLMERAAFLSDGPMVAGRLQLTPGDAALLVGPR